MSFGVDNVNVFQGNKSSVTKQVQDYYALFSIVCIVWHIIQTLYAYFAHSPEQHLEFTKLVKIVETKGNKILHNVKT
jgi:hypothetical protein